MYSVLVIVLAMENSRVIPGVRSLACQGTVLANVEKVCLHRELFVSK